MACVLQDSPCKPDEITLPRLRCMHTLHSKELTEHATFKLYLLCASLYQRRLRTAIHGQRTGIVCQHATWKLCSLTDSVLLSAAGLASERSHDMTHSASKQWHAGESRTAYEKPLKSF